MVGRRPDGFYRRISRMPGVALLSAETEPYQLIKNASIVITITGTAAFEAAVLQRPAVLLSNAYFQYMERGITRLRDHDNIREAVNTALNMEPASDDQLTQFLGGVFANSISIPSELLWSTKAQESTEAMNSSARIFANQLAKTYQRHMGKQSNST